MTYDIKWLSRRWFDEVWNQWNDDTISELAAENVIIHGLAEDGQTMRGTAGFLEFRQSFRAAFPDLKLNIQDVLLDGSKTAVRIEFTGTHTGEGMGLPPSHRKFRSTAIVILRWQEGKIVESWNEFDAARMMRQLTDPTISTYRTVEVAAKA